MEAAVFCPLNADDGATKKHNALEIMTGEDETYEDDDDGAASGLISEEEEASNTNTDDVDVDEETGTMGISNTNCHHKTATTTTTTTTDADEPIACNDHHHNHSHNHHHHHHHHAPPGEHNVVVDLHSMKDAVFFLFPDRNDRLSKFWLLLLAAAIIATSGVVGDSPATVIGAMIVAPLMIPILGIMLSVVLADEANFRFSLLLFVTGIGSCILIGTVFGFVARNDIFSPENNSQVAARVSPKLTDLIGALATGAVGSFSLVRKDISGALPGVAISISLVPPLSVAGLMLSGGLYRDAAGAMLLFTCNFLAIQVTGVIIMYIYGVHKMGHRPRATMQITVFAILILLLSAIAVLLV